MTDRQQNRVRLLLVSPFFPAHGGGVEIVAGHLASGWSARGLVVNWAASDCDAAPTAVGFKCMPMRSFNAIERKTGIPVPVWTWGAMKQLRQAAADCDVIVVHESLYLHSVLVAALAARLRKPLILIQHVGEIPYRSALLRALVKMGNRHVAAFVHRRAACVAYVSETVRSFFNGLLGEIRYKSTVIPNGFAASTFQPRSSDQRASIRSRFGLAPECFVMLFVGRFVEKKGLSLLRQLARQRPEWTWVFIGAGPMDPCSWGLRNVRVIGRLPHEQLADWYAAADLLVLPSVGEGFPLVVQEAMGSGLPAAVSKEVAHALPGVHEHVFSEAVGEDPDIVQRWLALLDAAAAGGAARRREGASRFASGKWSWDRCVDQHVELIQRTLSGRAIQP